MIWKRWLISNGGYSDKLSCAQLFLDDARMKNFTSCFKDKPFLKFFYDRLRPNETDRYAADFPYISLCGRERNFIRCDDVPIVFTHVLPPPSSTSTEQPPAAAAAERLAYAHAGDLLTVDFQPERIFMSPLSGRVYHPAGQRHGRIGLVRSKLAIEFSRHFGYESDSAQQRAEQLGVLDAPTRFTWNGCTHALRGDWVAQSPEGRAVLKRRFD